MSDNPPHSSAYDISAESAGFQEKGNYPTLIYMVFEGIKKLHMEGRHNEAIDYFYDSVPWFQSLSDMDETFKVNWVSIEERFRNDTVLTYAQARRQMYRLHASEFALMLSRQGVLPKPDIRIRYTREGTPKNIGDVLDK